MGWVERTKQMKNSKHTSALPVVKVQFVDWIGKFDLPTQHAQSNMTHDLEMFYWAPSIFHVNSERTHTGRTQYFKLEYMGKNKRDTMVTQCPKGKQSTNDHRNRKWQNACLSIHFKSSNTWSIWYMGHLPKHETLTFALLWDKPFTAEKWLGPIHWQHSISKLSKERPMRRQQEPRLHVEVNCSSCE